MFPWIFVWAPQPHWYWWIDSSHEALFTHQTVNELKNQVATLQARVDQAETELQMKLDSAATNLQNAHARIETLEKQIQSH